MEWLRAGLIISLLFLLTMMLRLGVIQGNFYRELARGNRVMEEVIPAGRGRIVDVKGRELAKSIYQYFRLEGESKIYESAGEYVGKKFEGKNLDFELKREYAYGVSSGVVTGYVSREGSETLRGRGGVEEFFEEKLAGVNGKRLVEVDAEGKYIRELGRVEPEMGEELRLSIDAYWQDRVYKMLSGIKAVVIMSQPKTGKVKVLVSSPGFDPNVFDFAKNDATIKSYLSDEESLPLLNRAIAARYHPGSVFKIAVAAGGLESGMINRGTTFEDTGFIKVGDYSYSNWLWTKRGATDGMVDIVTAIKRSNDIFFYRLGEKLGPGGMKKWANRFGLGEKTGIELPGEVAGIVPDADWKEKNKGERWFLGNSYHMAIGQGDVAVTPLQINQMTNVIANKGVRCRPRLEEGAAPECQDLKLKKETVEIISQGMRQACQSGGTAWPLFNFKTEIGCKTGTAEVGDGSKESHAWLTAFAPIDDPEISITVIVERGGEGSDVAAPIVGDILKEWFEEPETIVPRIIKN